MRLDSKERLVADLLDENGELHKAMLDGTLIMLSRQRRARQARRIGVAALCVASLLIAFWPRPSYVRIPLQVRTPAVSIVMTRPLPASVFVITSTSRLPLVQTAPGTVAFITTARTPVEQFSDEELLASAGEHPALLVRYTSGNAKFIWAEPNDRDFGQ